MYFVSDLHNINFKRLVKRFDCANEPDYKAACYIVAHPEIYRRIDDPGTSPVDWVFDEDGVNGESDVLNLLSEAYRELVRGAVELFTGTTHNFSLGFVAHVDSEVFRVLLQSLEVRRERY